MIERVKFSQYVTPPGSQHRVDIIDVKNVDAIEMSQYGVVIKKGAYVMLYPWPHVLQLVLSPEGIKAKKKAAAGEAS